MPLKVPSQHSDEEFGLPTFLAVPAPPGAVAAWREGTFPAGWLTGGVGGCLKGLCCTVQRGSSPQAGGRRAQKFLGTDFSGRRDTPGMQHGCQRPQGTCEGAECASLTLQWRFLWCLNSVILPGCYLGDWEPSGWRTIQQPEKWCSVQGWAQWFFWRCFFNFYDSCQDFGEFYGEG